MAEVQTRDDAASDYRGSDELHDRMLEQGETAEQLPHAAGQRPKRSRRADGERYRPVPPEKHRFKPGQTGNPKGRPRKRKQLAPTGLVTMIGAELMKTQKVKQGDKIVTMTIIEMIVKRLMQDAVSGDSLARTRAVKTFALLGAIDASAELQELQLKLEEASSNTGWTPEMEAAMAMIDAEFLEAEPGKAGAS